MTFNNLNKIKLGGKLIWLIVGILDISLDFRDGLQYCMVQITILYGPKIISVLFDKQYNLIK